MDFLHSYECVMVHNESLHVFNDGIGDGIKNLLPSYLTR